MIISFLALVKQKLKLSNLPLYKSDAFLTQVLSMILKSPNEKERIFCDQKYLMNTDRRSSVGVNVR